MVFSAFKVESKELFYILFVLDSCGMLYIC